MDCLIQSEYRKARLSNVRLASGSCTICKLLVKVAERFHDHMDPDPELVLDNYHTLRVGKEGPRVLRLCLDVG